MRENCDPTTDSLPTHTGQQSAHTHRPTVCPQPLTSADPALHRAAEGGVSGPCPPSPCPVGQWPVSPLSPLPVLWVSGPCLPSPCAVGAGHTSKDTGPGVASDCDGCSVLASDCKHQGTF
ncbi:hypothetical protein ACOMHN_056889 [Nucella lapillus]